MGEERCEGEKETAQVSSSVGVAGQRRPVLSHLFALLPNLGP